MTNECVCCHKQHMNFIEAVRAVSSDYSGHLFKRCRVAGVEPFYIVNYTVHGYEPDVLDYLADDWIVLDELSEFAQENIRRNLETFDEKSKEILKVNELEYIKATY